jgi:hypothetical protein
MGSSISHDKEVVLKRMDMDASLKKMETEVKLADVDASLKKMETDVKLAEIEKEKAGFQKEIEIAHIQARREVAAAKQGTHSTNVAHYS